jgi:hypothetical protein
MPYDATATEEEQAGGMDVLAGGQQEPSQDQVQTGQEAQELGTEAGTVTTEAPKRADTPSKTAGSGMFTNLKKYVEANKPKTKEMAGAVVKDISGQAEKIKSNVAEKRKQVSGSEAYKQEQARLQGGEQTTQSALQKAQSGQMLSADELDRFKALQSGTGAYEGFKAVDLAEQQQKARSLEQLGQQATTAEGSEQAIQQTFGKDIQDYTAGERGLDLFLLGQDKEAKQLLQEGVTGATTGIESDVAAQQAESQAAVQALRDLSSRYQTGGEFDTELTQLLI